MPIIVDGSKLLQEVQIDMLKEDIEEGKMLYKMALEQLKEFDTQNYKDNLKLFDEGDAEVHVYHVDDGSIHIYTSKDEFKEYVEDQYNKKKQLEEVMKTLLSNLKKKSVQLIALQCM